jgi:hypothetical protein
MALLDSTIVTEQKEYSAQESKPKKDDFEAFAAFVIDGDKGVGALLSLSVMRLCSSTLFSAVSDLDFSMVDIRCEESAYCNR